MVKKLPEQCISAGKARKDREVHPSKKFDPLNLELTQPDTAILLLKCKEKPIVIAAASALSSFAAKSKDNLDELFDLEIVESIIPLIDHEDIFTRRFATKLLAQMATITGVTYYLLQSDKYLSNFIKILTNNSDAFMQEFSSLIVAELTKEFYGAARFLEESSDFNYLFTLIQSPDPDVKKNSIEIINNLMKEPLGVQAIISSTEFNLILIYKLFHEPFAIIQKLAIEAIESLVMKCKDEKVQELFRNSGGLDEMLKILENPEWQDLHPDVLRVLSLACNNLKTVELMISTGGMQKLFKYLESAGPNLLLDIFRVIVKFADTHPGRVALHSFGVLNYLLNILRETVHPDIYGVSSYGIAKMTQYGPAASELTQENPMPNLLNFLKDDKLKWNVRQAAAFALRELIQCDFRNCQNFLEINGQSYMLTLIKQPSGTISQETQVTATQILKAIAKYPNFRENVINHDLIDAMCTPFEVENDELKIACCDSLSKFCTEEIGRKIFSTSNGVKRLYSLILENQSIPVRDSAVKCVQQLSTDPLLANLFVQAEYLLYMVKNRSASKIIATWDSCIESLMNSDLPFKFAYTGRLSLHDITQDGFYITGRSTCPFPILEDLFSLKISPKNHIYVVNCIQPIEVETDSHDNGRTTIKKQSIGEAAEQVTKESAAKGIRLSDEALNSWLELKFGRLQADPFLCEYVDLLKCRIIAAEASEIFSIEQAGLVDISLIASRAKLLGEFVDEKMSGPDPSKKCFVHQLALHLEKIKHEIQTSVIPLGQLRVGSYLERALLFKVLADKIGLPTALVRGEYGNSWVEVAIPKVEALPKKEELASLSSSEVEGKSSASKKSKSSIKSYSNLSKIPSDASLCHKSTIFPTKLLRSNYIVDLMNVPGDLIPICSKRAQNYCERRSQCDIGHCK
ncbi:armadillo repeat-containing protein 3 isoform X2 [Belonocnema kinseyi]|uniref:armadillo repeat-containing protein 3 isoform X2 n=1 Tax=Belonocnema kinseyi TaxID=2817044 RepID=UPI00143CF8E4|nr:armadillo repeat-containing protein 3 isoform X2 [Belonocnema kinseyi]